MVLRPDKIACPTALQLHKKSTFNLDPTMDPDHIVLLLDSAENSQTAYAQMLK